MWISKRKHVSVNFGIIHDVIWRGPPTSDLTVGKLLICSGQPFMREIPISLGSKPSLRFAKCQMRS